MGVADHNDIDIDIDGEDVGFEAPEVKKKGLVKRLLPSKKIILVSAALILLLVIGGGVWFFFFKGPAEPLDGTPEAVNQQTVVPEEEKEPEFEDVVTLAPFEDVKIVFAGSTDSLLWGLIWNWYIPT